MRKTSKLQILGALALGATLAMHAHAAEMTKEPVSVNEGAPDKAGKKGKGAAGVATMPGKGPSSVDEGAPQKTGKGPATPVGADSKKMANPKTPSQVNEGAPDKTGKGESKYGGKSADRKDKKDKDAMAR
jgi:hypothetical protein